MKWTNDHLAHDWFPGVLPENIELGANVYIESSYVFAAFFSQARPGLVMREGSGAYDLTSFVTGPRARITVGAYTCLNTVNLIAEDTITIGDHCLFAWGSVVTDARVPRPGEIAQGRKWAGTAADPLRRLHPTQCAPVHIAGNVWVGFDSVIMGGVSIGRGAVIGCKTVITQDVLPYAVVVGNPSRVVRFLEPDDDENARAAALREFALGARQGC
jgi:acetyltransferase-like isoleucine patch superfamily enzyme